MCLILLFSTCTGCVYELRCQIIIIAIFISVIISTVVIVVVLVVAVVI